MIDQLVPVAYMAAGMLIFVAGAEYGKRNRRGGKE